MSKKLHFMVVFCFLFSLMVSGSALAQDGDITVFYTNDIHTYIDNGVEDANGLTYAKVAALKKSEENALLVDAGDHIQGTAYGSMDNGSTMIRLMNAAGYDAATLGNHEFDYGMESCMDAIAAAKYPYLSCNFYHEKDGTPGNTVLDEYLIKEVNGTKIAFVGITTPESFTSSTPAYFQDADGNYIYGIAGGEDGTALYAAVQNAIDAARTDGADYVIALGHLGVDPSSTPWTSRDVIAHTSGLDAFIDGHSHTTIEAEAVTDQTGSTVLLTQTGSYLNAVGKMTISGNGEISCALLSGEDAADLTPDAAVKEIEDNWIAEIGDSLGTVIGYTEVTLDNYDSDGNRLVRKQNTNSGDFVTDALYHLFDTMGMDVDAAIMNGGGIRNAAITGEISYLTCKEMHSFGNIACLQAVSGQQILDALEWGAKDLSAENSVENGGFLQVSGIHYSIDPSIPSTVQKDEKGVWCGAPTGDYRVKDVQILNRETGVYEPIDLSATYHLAGHNYTLRNLGDGFAMFAGAVNVLDYVAEDYMVLADYVQSFPVDDATGLPTIPADSIYADVNGSGRITILHSSAASAEPVTKEPISVPTVPAESTTEKTAAFSDYTVLSGDCLWKIAQKQYGNGNLWRTLYEANRNTLQNPNQLRIGQILRIPS